MKIANTNFQILIQTREKPPTINPKDYLIERVRAPSYF